PALRPAFVPPGGATNRRGENLKRHPVNPIPALALLAGACLLICAPASGQQEGAKKKSFPNGVPPVHARKAPKPPSGPTPHTPEGAVDLSGVWVVSGSLNLPNDPSYQPWAQKLYDERKAAKGKGDPESFCLPDGAVRVTALPYKIVQGPKMIVVLSE